MSQLSDKAVEVAISQLGQQEKPIGSNWGHPVIDYLASVGIDFPAAWCLALIYWCFKSAAKELNTINPLVRTGGCLRTYSEATSHHVTNPQAGDIIIFNHGHGLGHAALIEYRDNDDLHTIEGNTNNNGSREGFEVERKIRHIGDPTIKGFLRY